MRKVIFLFLIINIYYSFLSMYLSEDAFIFIEERHIAKASKL